MEFKRNLISTAISLVLTSPCYSLTVDTVLTGQEVKLGNGVSLIISSSGKVIEPGGVAITVEEVEAGFIRVEESGLINGLLAGIEIKANAHLTEGLSNAGIIAAAQGSGIQVSASKLSGGIENKASATIYYTSVSACTGPCLAAAILTEKGALVKGDITNFGNIASSSGNLTTLDGGVVIASNVDADGRVVNVKTGLKGSIDNRGLISSVVAPVAVLGAELDGDITNSGTINAIFNGITISGASVQLDSADNFLGFSHSADRGATVTGSVKNSSVINAAGGHGVQIVGKVQIKGDIENSGNIYANNSTGRTDNNLDQGSAISISGAATTAGNIISSPILQGNIINSGNLAILNGFTNAVDIGNKAIVGGVENLVTGVVEAKASAIAITSGAELKGTLLNQGKLIAGIGAGIKLKAANITGGIVNEKDARISVKGPEANPNTYHLAGIQLSHGAGLSGGIRNAGSIELNTHGVFTGTSGIMVASNADSAGKLINKTTTLTGGIDNSGVINSGPADHTNKYFGIEVRSSEVVGDIKNSGQISSIAGIYLADTMYGDSDNFNIFSAPVKGSRVLVDGDIINSGSIKSSFSGVLLSGADLTGKLENSGAISLESSSFGETFAISIARGTMEKFINSSSGSIYNIGGYGFVASHGTVVKNNIENFGEMKTSLISIGVHGGLSATQSGTVTAFNTKVEGSIINTGLLESTGDHGISIKGNVSLTGDIDNRGVITAKNGLPPSMAGNDGSAIFIGSQLIDEKYYSPMVAGAVVNSGTLQSLLRPGGSGSGRAVLIEDGSVVDGGLENTSSGKILALDAGVLIRDGVTMGSLINAGIIESSENVGIRIETVNDDQGYGNTKVNGDISNSGTIKAAQQGIYLHSDSLAQSHTVLAGKIINSGTITSSYESIKVLNAELSSGIDNSGNLVSNSREAAVQIKATSLLKDESVNIGGGFTNSGTIVNKVLSLLHPEDASGTLYNEPAAGLQIENVQLNGGIDNLGSITSMRTAVQVRRNGEGGSAVSAATLVTGGFRNSGDIKSADHDAVAFYGARLDGGFVNSSNILGAVHGVIVSGLYASYNNGLISKIENESNAALIGDLINSGIIRSSGDQAHSGEVEYAAIAFKFGADLDGQLINSGLIEAAGGGVGVLVGSGGADLSGLKSSLSAVGLNVGGLPLSSLPKSKINGNIINTGTIRSASNPAIYIDHGSVAGIVNHASGVIAGGNGWAIKVERAAVIDIDGAAPSSLGFIENHGLIDGGIDFGDVAGVFTSVGGSSGSIVSAKTVNLNFPAAVSQSSITTINGDFSFTGDLNVQAQGREKTNGSNTKADTLWATQLQVSGAATLNGVSLSVNLISGADFVDHGDEINLIDASSLTTDINQASDNSAVLDFEVDIRGSDLYLVAKRNDLGNVVKKLGANTNTQNTAKTMEKVTGLIGSGAVSQNSVLAKLVSDIDSLGTPEEVVRAMQSLEPETATASSSVGGSVSADNGAAASVDKRVSALRGFGSGVAAGEGVEPHGFWLQGFNSEASQDTLNGIDGFDSDSGGFSLGLDAQVGSSAASIATVGLAFSYADTDLDSKGLERNTAVIDSYRLSLYGSYQIDQVFVDAQLGYAQNRFDKRRNIFNGLTALANYVGDHSSVRVRIARPINYESGFSFTPKASLAYHYLRERSYDEKGAGNAGLHIEGSSAQALLLSAGFEMAYSYQFGSGASISPLLGVSVQHDLIGDEVEINANFIGVAGTAFRIAGAPIEQSGVHGFAGLRILNQQNLSIDVRYNYLTKRDYFNRSYEASLRYRF